MFVSWVPLFLSKLVEHFAGGWKSRHLFLPIFPQLFQFCDFWVGKIQVFLKLCGSQTSCGMLRFYNGFCTVEMRVLFEPYSSKWFRSFYQKKIGKSSEYFWLPHVKTKRSFLCHICFHFTQSQTKRSFQQQQQKQHAYLRT